MPIEAASASTSVSHGANGPRPMRNTVAWATATSVAAATAVVAVAASSPKIAPKTAEPSAAAATVRRGGNAPSVAGSTEMRSICTPSARASDGPGNERVGDGQRQRDAAHVARPGRNRGLELLERVARLPCRDGDIVGEHRQRRQRRRIATSAADANPRRPRHVAIEPGQRHLRAIGRPRKRQRAVALSRDRNRAAGQDGPASSRA